MADEARALEEAGTASPRELRRAASLANVLLHLREYYAQWVPTCEQALKNLTMPIETKLKDQVKQVAPLFPLSLSSPTPLSARAERCGGAFGTACGDEHINLSIP